jgi:hypothetical protein
MMIGGAVVALVLASGVVLVRVGRSDVPTDRAPERVSGPEGRPYDDGSSTTSADPRLDHTEDGAALTAVVLAGASQRWLYLTDDDVRSSLGDIAAEGSVQRLTDEVLARIRPARDELMRSSGRIWWLVQPLAWRVERSSAATATVSVWFVTILSAVDVAIPQTAWRTGRFDLVWIDGSWWLDAMSDIPGPTPATGPDDDPWDAGTFDESLAGFTRLDRSSGS